MSQHQDSDSSDDDVWFGKYTISEAKRDWRKYIPKKINRRHTSICKLSEDEITIAQDSSHLAKDFAEKICISSDSNKMFPSAYLTANETMSTDRSSQNSEFLEKLTKVINEPVSEASSYNTAFDRTNDIENIRDQCDDTFLERFKNQTTFALDNVHHTLVENTVISTEDSFNKDCKHESKNNVSCSSEEIINDSVISISDESLSELQNSAYELLSNEDINVSKSPDLSNVGIEFEDRLSEAVNDEVCDSHSSISTNSPLIDHTNCRHEDSLNLQSENRNHFVLRDENKVSKSTFVFKNSSISDLDTEPNDYTCKIQLKDISENLSDSQDSTESTSFKHLQRFERLIDDRAQLSKISEKTEFTTCIEDGTSMKQQNNSGTSSTENLSEFQDINNQDKCIQELKTITTSDVHGVSFSSDSDGNKIPDIHVEQFDDSCQFDDTLEEMNRLLEQGIDYEMPEVIHPKVTPLKEPPRSNDIISGSFLNTSSNSAGLENATYHVKMLSSKSVEKCKQFSSADKLKEQSGKSKFQQELTYKVPLASARNLFTNTYKKLEVEDNFKVPTKPVKKMPTPSKLPKPFKSVVSPVGVYIKHSPKYCPMIRVPQSTGSPHLRMSELVRPNSISAKENIPCASNQEIPKVIYRPAKNREIKDKVGTLPESIKKLIKEPLVTKHEQRIEHDEGNQSIARRLMESDLSLNLSHNNQDISILTNKQPFSIKKF